MTPDRIIHLRIDKRIKLLRQPFSSRKARALRDFVSPHSSMVLILCKTALISGTLICSRPINHLSIFQFFNKFSLLCNSAMTPLWLRFFHILRYHQLPRHCLVEDNPLLVGKLGKLGKSKLGIFMYAHLFFQVNNKYNNYNIYIIIIIFIINLEK